MPRPYQLYCACVLIFCSLSALDIQAQSDSLPDRLASANAVRQYHAYLNPEPGLYRGSQYVIYAFQLKEGHPYFDQDQLQKGSVLYNGILYKDVPLIYDEVKGLLVTNDSYKIYRIALINEEIDSFTIQNHIFIKLKDTLNPTAPRAGFYELLHNGRITLLKKEEKIIREDITTGVINKYINQYSSFYLKKNNTWYAVNNKRELLHAFKDKSQELKKFMRSNKLKLRQDKDNTLIKTVSWYDSQRP